MADAQLIAARARHNRANQAYRARLAARTDLPAVPERKCSRCQLVKPAAAFSKGRSFPDGLYPICKSCAAETHKRRVARLKAEARPVPAGKRCSVCALVLSVSEFHKDSSSLTGLSGRCKECCKRHLAAWYDKNADKVIAQSKAWVKANPKKAAANFAQAQRNRQAKMRGSSLKTRTAEWLAILDYFNDHCAYCARPASEVGKLHADHMVPLSRGGTNEPTNIVPACRRCNSSKHARTPLEFIARQCAAVQEAA